MNGVIIVDKPGGRSSFWAVARIRHISGERKAGHAGALDPLATGVLVIGLGAATRILKFVEAFEKVYTAVMQLGVSTDTDDAEGKPLETRAVPPLDEEKIRAVFAGFTGRIQQRPPAYSAIKIEGERAYRRARRGETVVPKEREVEVRELALEGYEPGAKRIRFRMRCSKGTYVRSLARDVGEVLGCGAHLLSLRREGIGPLTIDRALSLEPEPVRERVEAALVPISDVLAGLPYARAGEEEEALLRQGRAVPCREAAPWTGEGLVLDRKGEPLCLALCRSRGASCFLVPMRMLK